MEFKGDLKAILVRVHLPVDPRTSSPAFDSRCIKIYYIGLRFKKRTHMRVNVT